MFPKTNIPNPLNFLDARKFSKKPKGMVFQELKDQSHEYQKIVENWIVDNLKSRYYIGKHIKIDKKDQITNSILVGFEDQKEMSIFNLSCPHITRH
jgi:hypothetical protein